VGVVVKIMTHATLRHLTNLAGHGVTDLVSSNQSHPTVWTSEWLQRSSTWGAIDVDLSHNLW